MSKILVLPGSEWQVPLVKKIKELGHAALVVSPEDNPPCKALADVYFRSDIFDIDAVERFARAESVDAVLSDECDIAMPVVAGLGKRLGLYALSPEDAALYTDKFLMREFCSKIGMKSPEYQLCRTMDEAVDFQRQMQRTMIIKPLDSNSSHGVFTVNTEGDIRRYFDEAMSFSRVEKAVILERYINGTEFTVDGVKTKDSHYTLAISKKKHYKHNPNIANELYFTYYSQEFDYEKLKEVNDMFVMNSSLPFGFTHAEYKYEDGEFYLIEIGARGGGNLISAIITQYMSGHDTYRFLIECALNGPQEEDFSIKREYMERAAVLRFFDTPGGGGVVKSVHGTDYMDSEPNIKSYQLNFDIGDRIEDAKSDSVRIGYYIACSENERLLQRVISTIGYELIIEVFRGETGEKMHMNERDMRYYESLINELRRLPVETEWVEFKVNNEAPTLIGEYLSSLSNSATLHEKETAYLLYGIHDKTHEIVGTKFHPKETTVGNEELENWLLTQLTPRADFKFVEIDTKKGRVVVVEIPAARVQPTAFKGIEYIRVGSYNKKLRDFPEKERKLWRVFDIRPYETMHAIEDVDSGTVTRILDTGTFYTLMGLPIPSLRDGIIHDFIEHGFVKQMDNGNYAITNMGALLFAKDIRSFDYLENKAIRVIRYKGSGRTNAIRDQFFWKGYAVVFDELMTYIMSMLPQRETIETALRQEFIMFPEKAIREIMGNMIIHQDMTSHGQGLMVEIFDERIEATNPGCLLVDVDRIIDTAPHARNEKMANFLRLVHICEARGSGFDRMEEGMRDWKIPTPKVETGEDFCRTMLCWHDSLGKWTKEEKIRTCYIYVCYCYVNRIDATNAVLRERFGIPDKNKAVASRIIRDTVERGYIRLYDDSTAPRYYRYVPYWA